MPSSATWWQLNRSRIEATVLFAAWLYGAWLGFGVVFFICAVLYAILANVSRPSSSSPVSKKVSAYSVFNEGYRALPGTLDASEYDAHLRRGTIPSAAADGSQSQSGNVAALARDVEEFLGDSAESIGGVDVVLRSRAANRPCPCGSGRKTKKCCGKVVPRNPEEDRLRREWERDWT